jgi:hypothetical protein
MRQQTVGILGRTRLFSKTAIALPLVVGRKVRVLATNEEGVVTSSKGDWITVTVNSSEVCRY